jgi:SnoaL-like domain
MRPTGRRFEDDCQEIAMNAPSAHLPSTRRKLLIGAVAAGTAAAIFPTIAGASDASGATAEVKKAIDGFFEAARRQDWDAAGKVLAPDFHLWSGVDNAWDRAAYIDILKEDDLKVVDMSLQDLEIGVSADESLAWARYRATVEAISKDRRSVWHTAETIVFEHQREAGWLMRHIQVSHGTE